MGLQCIHGYDIITVASKKERKKKMKKLWLLLISVLLMATVQAAETGWQEKALEFAREKGLWTEETLAMPEEPINRGLVVFALAKLNGEPEEKEACFSDVSPEAAYAPAVGWAAVQGIIQGDGSGSFYPEQPATREELAVMTYRFLTFAIGTAGEGKAQLSFADKLQISGFAEKAVAQLKDLEIFTGEIFRPKEEATVAEAAVVLQRVDKLINSKNTAEIKTIPAFDGYPLTGKLDLPAGGTAEKLVIFVNGSGPNTYDNRRTAGDKEFNYFDLFAQNLTAEGIAFFRYNTRGVTPGEKPPMFMEVDDEAYQTYLPENSVRDIEAMVRFLKEDDRLKEAKVLLLGWSEGTMIAPAAAARGNVPIDALLLAGYCNDTMEEILEWQQSGGSGMVFYCQYFDYDGDGTVSKEEFEQDRYGLRDYVGAAFEEIDADQDGRLTEKDFALLLKESREAVFRAFESGDDQWLKANYGVQLTGAWYQQHLRFAPNRETLPKLSLPIHIFHGTSDANVSVQGVYEIQAAFEKLGKDNLTAHCYEGFDHDLNYMQYISSGTLPQSFADIFRICKEL